MIHQLGDLGEIPHCNLPCNRVEEGVEFTHDVKRRSKAKAFANGMKRERVAKIHSPPLRALTSLVWLFSSALTY